MSDLMLPPSPSESTSQTEFIRRRSAWEHLMYWKLGIIKGSGKAGAALIGSLIASLNEKSWSEFTGTGKFIVVATSLLAMWQVLEAFLGTEMADLKAGQDGKNKKAEDK